MNWKKAFDVISAILAPWVLFIGGGALRLVGVPLTERHLAYLALVCTFQSLAFALWFGFLQWKTQKRKRESK